MDQFKLLGLPSIIPGEAFSSWIWRSMIAGRLSLEHLRKVWKLKCEVYWADTDVTLIDFRKVTKTLNATSLTVLQSSTWETNAHLSLPQTVGLTVDPLRKRPIYRYCSQCLKEDEIPYIRRRWRLAFTYVCEKHNLLMEEQCQRCHHFLSMEMSPTQKIQAVPSIRFCMQCGHDLGIDIERIEVPGLLDCLLSAQSRLASYTVDRQASQESEQLVLTFDQDEALPKELPMSKDHFKELSEILMRFRYYDGREVQTLFTGICGTTLFGDDAQRVGSFFAKYKLFRTTFWFPENVVFHSSDLKTLKKAQKWLRDTKTKATVSEDSI